MGWLKSIIKRTTEIIFFFVMLGIAICNAVDWFFKLYPISTERILSVKESFRQFF